MTELDSHANLDLFEPTSFKQAIKHAHWQKAMAIEYEALLKNDIY